MYTFTIINRKYVVILLNLHGNVVFIKFLMRPLESCTLVKKCYRIYSISAKSMYIIDSNQYTIEFLAYLLVLIAYFLKSIVTYFWQKCYRFNSIFFSVYYVNHLMRVKEGYIL